MRVAASIKGWSSGSFAPRSTASISSRESSKYERSSTRGSACRRDASTSATGGLLSDSRRPVFTAAAVGPSGPSKSTSFRPASFSLSTRVASASMSLPAPRARLLSRDEGAGGKEVFLEVRVHGGVAPPVPLEEHGEVLLLLVTVVSQDGLQVLIGRRVDALIVPVGRLQLLLHGGEGPVIVQGFGAQLVFRLVIPRRVRHRHSSEIVGRCSVAWGTGQKYRRTDATSTVASRARVASM